MTSSQPHANSQASAPTLAQVVATLDRAYPPTLAESWDSVGLIVGDPDAPVRRVLVALDPVYAVVREALDWGADLLVTHHPLFLKPVHQVAATTFKGEIVTLLARAGAGLYNAHTNADAVTGGVAQSLAESIGLADARPLVPAPLAALDKIVVFVPLAASDSVRSAMTAAGAGALGDYDSCTWRTAGLGTFRALPGAHPYVGQVGALHEEPEDRIEMVVPRYRREAVVAALRSAHPYEEPAFDIFELASMPSPLGIGRVGALAEATTLGELARVVAQAVAPTVQGVRVAGPLDAPVRTVAVLPGSGDSLFDAVRAADADVYVTSDLRHHPASEARERAEFEARRRGEECNYGRPYLIDTAHWAAESPWTAQAAAHLREALPGVEVRVSDLRTDPWTARISVD